MNQKPQIIHVGPLDEVSRDALVREQGNPELIDIFETQLEELHEIGYAESPNETWILYPDTKQLLHCIGSEALFALRTNRNQLLITQAEQQQLKDAVVGIAGMSVGSGIAIGLTYSGASDTIKIADRDILSTANLNRLREPLSSVGKPKVMLAANHIYGLNPYANVITFDDGVTQDNIDGFFSDPKLSVVVDEIDDFKVKVQLRLKAREHRTPLLMFTSLGDNILIDVERYDVDPQLEIFNGLLGDVPSEVLANPDISPDDIRRYSVSLVGQEYIPTRALQSVAEMGKTLVGRPQLYSTIAIDGGLAAYTIRQIILGAPVNSGRYFVSFADFYKLEKSDLAESDERKQTLERIFSRG